MLSMQQQRQGAVARRSAFGRTPARAQPRVATAGAGAKAGDFVQVHYTGTLDDATVFDSSRERTPLDFVVGAGKVIKGFDRCVSGLAVGESRKLRIEPADAYGAIDPSAMIKVPTAQAPQGLKAGVQVQLSNGMVARVASADAESITLDLNHELAGKPLTFEVELMALCPAERMQRATFGMGCFWGPELRFQRVPGVLSTEVGYCNGTVDEPTYEAVCSGQTGHAEVVQVIFDPEQVTYEQLLDAFWAGHDPTTLNRQGGDAGTQYRSGVYCHTPAQLEAALKSKAAAQAKLPNPIVTEIADISKYSPAEPYHQQYLSRGGRHGKPQNPEKRCNDPIRCYG